MTRSPTVEEIEAVKARLLLVGWPVPKHALTAALTAAYALTPPSDATHAARAEAFEEAAKIADTWTPDVLVGDMHFFGKAELERVKTPTQTLRSRL